MRKSMLLIAGLLFVAGPVLAELCPQCKGKSYTKDMGQCSSCSAPVTSGEFKLCKKCSKAQGLCEHCKGPLAASNPSTQPAAAAAIDTSKSGKFTSGKWEYRYTIFGQGTKSEGSTGDLLYGGESVAVPASVNDYYSTPWGNLYWNGMPVVAFGAHGWMPKPLPSKPVGKLLPEPKAE